MVISVRGHELGDRDLSRWTTATCRQIMPATSNEIIALSDEVVCISLVNAAYC